MEGTEPLILVPPVGLAEHAAEPGVVPACKAPVVDRKQSHFHRAQLCIQIDPERKASHP